MVRRIKVYEDHTKVLYEGSDPGTFVQYFKDYKTTLDANALVEGKGALNNLLSEHFMVGLGAIGVPTHFLKRLNMREQLIRSCETIPLEITIRNYAAGSLVERLGLEEGAPLPRPIIEFYYKDAKLGKRFVSEEHILAFGWAGQQDLDDIIAITLRANDFMSGVMYGVGIRLVDFKVEFGRVFDGDYQRLIISDAISPDLCRLLDIATGRRLDKGVEAGDSENLTDVYTEVARRLGVLPANATPISKPILVN